MSVSYDFAGQTAIVTGGARGIGRAISAGFIRAGAQVWIWDLDPIELDGAYSIKADVMVARQIENALTAVLSHSTGIDVLVNNAGYLGPHKHFEQFGAAEWEHLLRVNLLGVLVYSR